MSLAEKLAAERRGRLAAERLLELKQAELYAANRKLGLHAQALSNEIVETRAEVASVRDENRRVKSDLSVATHNLEIAERRLWHSIQTIQDGFAFFDNDDRLIAANEAYMVVFEGLEEIKPGVAYARILQLLTEEGIVDTGELSLADWRAFMMHRRQEAAPEPVTIRMWNDQYIKLMDHRGSGGDLVSLGLNITSTVQYERELKSARERAETAARAKSAFLANMSHEIRTPMNGVVGMAELLAESPLDDEQSLYVDTIRNSGEALLVIINDILDFSKIEAEKMVLHDAPFDLEKSVHEVQMLVQTAAREKGVALLIDYDMFLPHEFVGDMGRIRQILTNLVGNAVKFTSEGHVLIRITGSPASATEQMFLHIAIEDTGIGIAKEQLDHIFAEFTQVEDERNRKFEGTGLGLAISKRLVELMGGEIWAESEVGVGSCFGFKIPMKIAHESKLIGVELPKTLQKIMVVDPSQVNRDILRRQLEFLGIAADGYSSDQQAKEHISDGYDLILLEQDMSGVTQTEFLASVGQQVPTIPVVILTSNSSTALDDSVASHVAAVLQRPLQREKLVSVLSEIGAKIATLEESPDDNEPVSEPEPVSDQIADAGPPPMFQRHREPTVTEESPGLPDVEPEASSLPSEQQPSLVETPIALQDEEPSIAVLDEDSDAPVDSPAVQSEDLFELPQTEQSPDEEDGLAKASEELPALPLAFHHEPEDDPVSDPVPDQLPDPVMPEREASPTVPDVSLEIAAPEPDVELKEPELSTLDAGNVDVGVDETDTNHADPDAEDVPRKMRILAAEDNKTNQLVFRKMIKSLDIELQLANDGAEAVAAYQSFDPDLVFMDISMPGMDGKEATHEIRKIEETTGKHVPIVALTAHAQQGDEAPILQAGLDHYLTKPLRKPAIHDMIRKLIPEDVAPPFGSEDDLRQAG